MSRLFFLLPLLWLTPTLSADPFTPTSFQLYYGNDKVLLSRLHDGLRKGQVVVIDTRALSRSQRTHLLREAERLGAKILGYVSVGELHDSDKQAFRKFLASHLQSKSKETPAFGTIEDIVLERNREFQSERVDVLAKAWQNWVLAEAERVLATGVHGLFLDTVDTVDVYIVKKDWPLERRIDSVEAMIRLVRELKARKKGQFVLLNRALNLIGEKVFVGNATGKLVPGLDLAGGGQHNPDGVLWEDAFSTDNDWTRRVEKDLRAIQKSGKVHVFALGYRTTAGSPVAFFRRCAAVNFIAAWATSSASLGKEVAAGAKQ